MNTVLVTGARGFIGRHCLRPLADAGLNVHAVTSASPSPDTSKSAVWHTADLLNDVQASRLIDEVRPVAMLHLAWVTTPGVYWASPLNDTWRRASEHLIDCAAACGLKRVVAAGTCAEYDWAVGRCDEHSTPLAPTSAYSRSKHELRSAIDTLAGRHGFSAAWARIFFLYGPGEPAAKLAPSVIDHLLRNEPAECSDGAHRRDFIYVRDAAAALVALLQSDLVGPVNIGSGEAPRVRQIATTIGRAMGKPDLIRLGARKSDRPEPPLVVAGMDRLTGELGFRPRWDLDAGLAETIVWRRGGQTEQVDGR